MKKLLILTSIVLLFSTCDNENELMSNQELLIGTWEDSGEDTKGAFKHQFTFTDTNEFTEIFEGYQFKDVGFETIKEPFNNTYHGTYQADNSIITFTYVNIESANSTGKADYSINGNTLIMSYRNMTLTFKKVN